MGATKHERQADIKKYPERRNFQRGTDRDSPHAHLTRHGKEERASEGPIEIVACTPDMLCQGYAKPGPVWERPRTGGQRR